MMAERRRRTRRTRRPAPANPADVALARDWAWELSSVEYLGLSRAELELRLRGQVPEALRRTLLLLTDRLLANQPITAEAAQYRLSRLLIELTSGWVDAAKAHHRPTLVRVNGAQLVRPGEVGRCLIFVVAALAKL